MAWRCLKVLKCQVLRTVVPQVSQSSKHLLTIQWWIWVFSLFGPSGCIYCIYVSKYRVGTTTRPTVMGHGSGIYGFLLFPPKTGYLPDDKQLIWNRLEIHPGFAGNEIQTIRWASVTPVRWGVTVGTVGCQSSQSPCITSICDALLMQNWTLLAWDDPWHSMKASRDFRRTFWTSIIGLCDCEFPKHILPHCSSLGGKINATTFTTLRNNESPTSHPSRRISGVGRAEGVSWWRSLRTTLGQIKHAYIYVCICMYLI